MTVFNPLSYGPVFAELVSGNRDRALGPGQRNTAMQEKLAAMEIGTAFAQQEVVDRCMAELCLAAVWLIHDFLDASHSISQRVESSSGAYWHAIMHRREPDDSNAKYWNRRVADHPVYDSLCGAARQFAKDRQATGLAEYLASQRDWDADAFVDLCAAARRAQPAEQGRGELEALCRAIQQREWELLFDHCYHQATST